MERFSIDRLFSEDCYCIYFPERGDQIRINTHYMASASLAADRVLLRYMVPLFEGVARGKGMGGLDYDVQRDSRDGATCFTFVAGRGAGEVRDTFFLNPSLRLSHPQIYLRTVVRRYLSFIESLQDTSHLVIFEGAA